MAKQAFWNTLVGYPAANVQVENELDGTLMRSMDVVLAGTGMTIVATLNESGKASSIGEQTFPPEFRAGFIPATASLRGIHEDTPLSPCHVSKFPKSVWSSPKIPKKCISCPKCTSKKQILLKVTRRVRSAADTSFFRITG